MKKKEKKFTTLRVRFTIMWILIMVIAFGLCIILNMFFLEKYYRSDKEHSMLEAIGEMNSMVDTYMAKEDGETISDEDTEELKESLQEIGDRYWRKDNLSAMIVGADGKYLLNSGYDARGLEYILLGYSANMNSGTEILYQSDQFLIVTMFDKAGNKEKYMDAFGQLNDGSFFVMRLTMESFRESTSISNRFLMFTGFMICFFAAIYIYFATKRMTKPVVELTDIARKMSDEDFSVRYEGNAHDEIGVLGTTMNDMAAQLEKNITDLKQANIQLQKDIEEKIQIDELRKEFLSNVSHELKTPIAIIMGYAEGLSDCVNDDPESQAFYCDVIMDEANKMNTMVQKLLNLNHLEFGTNACEMTDFDLQEMIDGMRMSTQILLEQKGGTMEYERRAADLYVNGDEFMIEEVLKNYISNAVNHLDGQMKIRILTEDAADGRVRVSVFNTGEPIPEESLEKVWVKFYKVDKARTRAYGGSGIGLSIVKAIMEQHDCPYGVKNTEDGVCFFFELNKAKRKEQPALEDDLA